MNDVLIDTSIWIDYFRGTAIADPLSDLIDLNRIATNDLILAELIPSINQRKERRLKHILLAVRKVRLEIDWPEIMRIQTLALKKGFNNIGIPDLIIAQNALHNGLALFENDKHFVMIRKLSGLQLFRSENGRQ